MSNETTLNSDSPENQKFIGIVGLSIGIASGYLSVFGNGIAEGLGIMVGVVFGGITSGFFISFLVTKKQFIGNQMMLLTGLVSGFFIGFFVSSLIRFLILVHCSQIFEFQKILFN